jgi:uncharacterized membrane protein (TIGR02234 family)
MMMGAIIMAARRLSAFRLLGLTVALGSSLLMLISSQLPWIHTTSPIAFGNWIDIRVDSSGSLGLNAIKVLVVAALAVAVLAVTSLIPYLRFLCAAIVVIGGVCIALALGVMSEINNPDTSNFVGHTVSTASQRSPATGIYVLIAGSALAIISGALTLLTPRTVPRYRYGAASYGAPHIQIAAPAWNLHPASQPLQLAGRPLQPTRKPLQPTRKGHGRDDEPRGVDPALSAGLGDRRP